MSCKCTKSELNLFSVPPTQTGMEHSNWVEYYLVTTVTKSSLIEFDISGTGDDYIDFANTILYVKAKITQNDGTNLPVDVATVRCFRLEVENISPTRSTATLLNAISITGILPKGTLGTRSLLIVLWRTWQEWQNRVISPDIPGHQKLATIRSWVW